MVANNKNYPEQLSENEYRRFWVKVNKDGPWSLVKNIDGKCWDWTAFKAKNGYGKFTLRGKKALAHRLSYVMIHGQINENLLIDHLCRNRKCVNPRHLEAVTTKENIARGDRPRTLGDHERIKTHCPRNHPLEIPNLVPAGLKVGIRRCLSCNRALSYLKSHSGDAQKISDEYFKKIVTTR